MEHREERAVVLADDSGIRIELRCKERDHVLEAVQSNGLAEFRRLEESGVVENAEAALSRFVAQLKSSESIWKLTQSEWVSPAILSLLVLILSEAWGRRLIQTAWNEAPNRLKPSAGLPTSHEKLSDAAKTLDSAKDIACGPLISGMPDLRRPALALELDNLASIYRSLAYQAVSRSLPKPRAGHQRESANLAEELGRLLEGFMSDTERRTWTAKIITDFFGEPTSSAQLRNRESAHRFSEKRKK